MKNPGYSRYIQLYNLVHSKGMLSVALCEKLLLSLKDTLFYVSATSSSGSSSSGVSSGHEVYEDHSFRLPFMWLLYICITYIKITCSIIKHPGRN